MAKKDTHLTQTGAEVQRILDGAQRVYNCLPSDVEQPDEGDICLVTEGYHRIAITLAEGENQFDFTVASKRVKWEVDEEAWRAIPNRPMIIGLLSSESSAGIINSDFVPGISKFSDEITAASDSFNFYVNPGNEQYLGLVAISGYYSAACYEYINGAWVERTDLAQTLEKAKSAYQKPANGIPASDLKEKYIRCDDEQWLSEQEKWLARFNIGASAPAQSSLSLFPGAFSGEKNRDETAEWFGLDRLDIDSIVSGGFGGIRFEIDYVSVCSVSATSTAPYVKYAYIVFDNKVYKLTYNYQTQKYTFALDGGNRILVSTKSLIPTSATTYTLSSFATAFGITEAEAEALRKGEYDTILFGSEMVVVLGADTSMSKLQLWEGYRGKLYTITKTTGTSCRCVVTTLDLTQLVVKSVNDLTNYYTKTQTYTKEEVQQLVSSLSAGAFIPVAELPVASADTYGLKIYLVPSTDPQTQNIKDEFITIRSGSEGDYTYSWEQIGSTAIDLSDYVTEDALETVLADYALASAIPTALSQLTDDSTHRLVTDTEKGTWNAKYSKPGTGIPKTDLASGVQNSLDLADSAVQATPVGQVTPEVNPYDYATREELNQLGQEVDGIIEEHIDSPLSQAGTTRYYIKTDVSVGETVDLTEVMSGSYANFKHYIEDCVPGDVFIINGTGTSAGELWCFIDSSNKKISSSGGVPGSGLSKTAPAGAAKIIINDRTGNGTQYKRVKGLLAQINAELDEHDAKITSLQAEVSSVSSEVENLEHKVGTNNYDNAAFSADYNIWVISAGKVAASSSSYANQRIISPIAIQEGDKINITQEVYGEALKAILADANDNVIDSVTWQGSVTNYSVPSGATKLYVNKKSGAAFSCAIQSAYSLKLDSIVSGEIAAGDALPVYSPLPQSAADGQSGSLDAENSTSSDIHNAIDAAIANYGRYAYGEILGKDATNTYDIKRYALCRADLFAWRASGPFYAWENGGVTYYIKTCSPYVGADIYNAARSTVVGTVSAFSSVTGIMTDNSSRQYTRKASSDVMPDIIYTIRDTFSFDFDVYTKAGIVITRLSKTAWDSVTNTITYNSKSYVRSRVDDWGRNTKVTVVIWANEHAAQSDPHEPAIVCYRLIRDLCQSGPSNNKFLSFLKNFCKVFIIPVVNPYGLNNYAVSKNTAGRLNGNGVNLNRNYPTVGWTQGSGANYGGSYGGSEIEVQYVINTCIEFGANIGIDVHCLSYTTEANEGVCAYGGNDMICTDSGTKDIDLVINSMLADFSIILQNYGEASATGEGEGKNWLLANGIEGGLVEMNAGPYATSFNGTQHGGHIIGADYTLLLRMLNLWNKRYNKDLALNNYEIS